MIDLTAPRFIARTLVAAGLWTALVWGSRVRLLTDAEAADWTNRARIVISLVFSAALMVLAARARRTGRTRAPMVLTAFSLWMVIVWVPSLLSVAAGEESIAFKAVHAILAVVSLAFGTALAGHARRESLFDRATGDGPRPHEAAPSESERPPTRPRTTTRDTRWSS